MRSAPSPMPHKACRRCCAPWLEMREDGGTKAAHTLGCDDHGPKVRYIKDGVEREIICDVIAGCDCYHGEG